MYTYVFLATEILYVMTIYRSMNILFKNNVSNRFLEKILYLALYICVSFVHLKYNIPALTFVTNLLLIFSTTLCYKGSIRIKILYTILILVTISIIELSVVIILSNISEITIVHSNAFVKEFVLIIASISRYSIVLIIEILFRKKENNIIPSRYIFYIITISMFSFIVFCCLATTFIDNNDKTMATTLSVFTLLICIMLFHLFSNIIDIMDENSKKILLSKQVEFYEKQFEIEQEYIDTIRKIKHDTKNHLNTVRNIIDAGEIQQSIAYIDELNNKIDMASKNIQTGNTVLDGILNVKINELNKLNTKVNLDLKIPKHIKLSPISTTIILGNILDNAIQGVSTINNNRFVKILLEYINESLFIEVQNNFDGKLKYSNNIIVSRKNYNHGIGLNNIAEEVYKYDGFFNIEVKNNIFIVNVMLRNIWLITKKELDWLLGVV